MIGQDYQNAREIFELEGIRISSKDDIKVTRFSIDNIDNINKLNMLSNEGKTKLLRFSKEQMYEKMEEEDWESLNLASDVYTSIVMKFMNLLQEQKNK